jgi:hypothetical protein
MVTVEPGTISVTANEKKPWGKSRPEGGVPHGVEVAAVSLAMPPALAEKVAVPVPVAVSTVAVSGGIRCA